MNGKRDLSAVVAGVRYHRLRRTRTPRLPSRRGEAWRYCGLLSRLLRHRPTAAQAAVPAWRQGFLHRSLATQHQPMQPIHVRWYRFRPAPATQIAAAPGTLVCEDSTCRSRSSWKMAEEMTSREKFFLDSTPEPSDSTVQSPIIASCYVTQHKYWHTS